MLTPNQFEAELLARCKIDSVQAAVSACEALHNLGPPTIVLTTLDTPDASNGGKSVAMMLSERGGAKWLLQLPFIEGGPFTGTGDLTAAMLLAWAHTHPHELPAALEKAGAVLQHVIKTTISLDNGKIMGAKVIPPELKIISCKRMIEEPPVAVRCQLVVPLSPAVRGVIVDAESFATQEPLRELLGRSEGADTNKRTCLNPSSPIRQIFGSACLERLEMRGVRIGLLQGHRPCASTRIVQFSELQRDTCVSVATPNAQPDNPHNLSPEQLCCSLWGLEPPAVLFVSDHTATLERARAAGSATVALLSESDGDVGSGSSQTIDLTALADFTVSSLDALRRLIPE